MKTRIYVESSVISYLTAKPSSDIFQLARQQWTYAFWERRNTWDLVITPLVMDEITLGDPAAASQRVLAAKECKVLPLIPKAEEVALLLIKNKVVPEKSTDDALHLALAAAHGIPYLLTWNQKHLDNLHMRRKIEIVIQGQGLKPASVLSPERLMEEEI